MIRVQLRLCGTIGQLRVLRAMKLFMRHTALMWTMRIPACWTWLFHRSCSKHRGERERGRQSVNPLWLDYTYLARQIHIADSRDGKAVYESILHSRRSTWISAPVSLGFGQSQVHKRMQD